MQSGIVNGWLILQVSLMSKTCLKKMPKTKQPQWKA